MPLRSTSFVDHGRLVPYLSTAFVGGSVNPKAATWYQNAVVAGGNPTSLHLRLANALAKQIDAFSGATDLQYFLPLIGDDIITALTPLYDRGNWGRPTNTNFVDGDVSNSTGLQGNGTNKRLTLTGVKANQLGSGTNGSLFWWETAAPPPATNVIMGAYPTTGNNGFILYTSSGEARFRWGNSANSVESGEQVASAFYLGQRSSATLRQIYINGVLEDTDTTSDSAPNANERDLTLFGAENSSSNFFWGGRAGLAGFANGTLTPTEIANLYTILNSFMVATGRDVAAPTLLTNLIEWWPLDEVSGNRAGVHSGLTLTDNNSVTSNPGVDGTTAAQFTAANTEYLSRASEASLQIGDVDFTFAVWLYLDSVGVDRTILSKHDGATASGSEFLIRYDHGTTQFRFAMLNGGTATAVQASTFGTPSTGTWYMLILQYDAANDLMGISVNNGTMDTTAQAGGTNVLTNPFVVGAVADLSPFNGRMQRIGFWKRLLTDAEKAEIYNAGNGISYPFS